MHDPLADALRAVAPAGVVVASLPLDDGHLAHLHPDEAALVACARELRRREFATGRALLHRLLPGSGAILRTAAGAPQFGEATVGSLAHDRHHALAAIASAAEFAAVGVDLEPQMRPAHDRDHELADAVLRDDDPAIDTFAAFTMKEAVYKAWSALGGPVVGPLDVRLIGAGTAFVAAMPSWPDVQVVSVSAAGYWLALAAVPRTLPTR